MAGSTEFAGNWPARPPPWCVHEPESCLPQQPRPHGLPRARLRHQLRDDSDANANPDPKPDSDAYSKPDPKPDAYPKPDSDPDPEPKPDILSQARFGA